MQRFIMGLAHVGYQVSEMNTSLAFYTRLGFSLQDRYVKQTDAGSMEVAFIRLKDVTLELYQVPHATRSDMPRCGIDHIALNVDSLSAVRACLQSLDYSLDEGPVHEERNGSGIDFILIRGPDGERLEFNQARRKI